jgi:xylulokinase
VGAADSVCAAAGLGVRRAGEVAYMAGTSTAILGVTDHLRFDDVHRYLVTPLAGAGWGLEMDLLSTGSAVRWLAGLFGLGGGGEASILRLAAEAPAGSGGLSFLPFLARGEQGALWDPGLLGAIGGLTTAHGRPEVARSLLEGIVLESRRCLSVLDESSEPACGEVAVAGWPGKSDLFPQMLADATGRPVRADAGGDAPSAAGAALLVSGGASAGLDRPVDARSYHPSAEGRAVWTDLWARHGRALAAVRSSEA